MDRSEILGGGVNAGFMREQENMSKPGSRSKQRVMGI